jgi:peptidoglycan-associated lipoprotein
VIVVSPSVRVAAEQVATCKLDFNDAASAPKFGFDVSELGADDDDILTQIARCVTTGPLAGGALDLVGRADSRGESEYTMALGALPAASVRDYLASLGIADAKLATSLRGKLDATGVDEGGWMPDRRVDVLLR